MKFDLSSVPAGSVIQQAILHLSLVDSDTTTDTTYTITADKVTGKNPVIASATGYTAENYHADPRLWLRMVHREDQPALLEQAEKAAQGETPPSLEHRFFHRDGEIRWARNTVIPRRDELGNVIAYDGLVRDITARKSAEERVVKSEAFYHSLVESLPQHILRKDLSERFTFANQKFCLLLGMPLDQIIGRTDFDFFQPELASKYQADDRHVIKTGRTFETVEINQTPGGDKRFVNVIKSPIHDSKGRVIGIQGIFWDITERIRNEEQLRRAHEDLGKSHADLKAAQLQLIQAAKMESIGTLAAGVAHEVKNPLATMAMGVKYLERNSKKEDETTTMVLSEMRDAIGRADKITRGLLDFAASHQLEVRPEGLNGMLTQTLALLRHEFNQQQIKLTTDFAPDLPRVAIEKNQIQQVFVNVFMNALQALDAGGTVHVRTRQQKITKPLHDEGSRTSVQLFVGDTVVVAEIEDSGPGIPHENLAKIFDPFFTTKPTGVGTGLGLPVSKKIIELHGGLIDITNRPEGGVRVTIMLPGERLHEKESPARG